MSSIYEQHDKAFNRVAAYVVMQGAERVATIAFKFPADGAGRLYAYVQWLGCQMVRGSANGGGYDKRSAAVEAAVAHIPLALPDDGRYLEPAQIEARKTFRGCLENIGGSDWRACLENSGFKVWQAV